MTESTNEPLAESGTSAADADESGVAITDDQLPEDLQPGDDNPLAKPLDPDDEATKSPEELEMDATQEGLGNDDGASTAPNQGAASNSEES